MVALGEGDSRAAVAVPARVARQGEALGTLLAVPPPPPPPSPLPPPPPSAPCEAVAAAGVGEAVLRWRGGVRVACARDTLGLGDVEGSGVGCATVGVAVGD